MFRPPGQKRASAPKVRTGCITCKTRRVKCDETKPRCGQCTKSARNCVWKRETVSSTSRPLIPFINSSNAAPPASLIKTPSQLLPFQDEKEPQYFHAYQDVVHRELSAALTLSPWFYSVLRACHTEPSILRAVVAIGALNKSWKLAHFADYGPAAMKAVNLSAANSHREYALKTYSKALAGLHHLTLNASEVVNLRHILIGSLLVHCIEFFLQSPETAFQHSAAGYALLVQYITANQDTTKTYKWTSSPDTAVIEDAIFHEHIRLQNDRALSIFSPPLSYHQAERLKGEAAVLDMPKTFSTLLEAQDHGELLMHRTTHLIAEIRATIKQTHELLAHPLDFDLPGIVVDPCDLPHMSHLFEARRNYLAELHAWRDSFAPLLSRLSLAPDTRSVVGSAIQQNHALNGIIVLSTILDPSETIFEQYYAKQAEVISLIVRSMKSTPHITNDLRPVFHVSTTFHDPIANIAASCRDKALREQAITIMIRMSPIDGVMQRQRNVFSHKYLVELEELNRLPGGDIPNHLRYKIIGTYTHGKEDYFTAVLMRRVHAGPKADTYPSTKKYRWKTWTKEQAAAFEVGDLVSDLEGEQVVDREREEEIRKWPKGLAKPAWIKWWEIFHEMSRSVVQQRLRPVRDTLERAMTIPEESEWIDIPEDSADATVQQQQHLMEQVGGYGGWVPYLDVFPSQDLEAIHQSIYRH